MTLANRAAFEIAVWAFAAVALTTALLYVFAFGSVPISRAVTTAVALGSVGGITGFLAASSLVKRRSQGEGMMLGARRGAGVAVCVLFVSTSVHAVFTFGSAGFLHALFWQVGYSLLLCGAPFAAAGAALGRSIDRRILDVRGAPDV